MAIKLNGVMHDSTIGTESDLSHGAYILANNPALYMPQQVNHFDFVVTNLGKLLRAGANGTEENAYIDDAQNVLRIAVSSASVPHFTQGIIEVRKGNSVVKFAGVPTFASGTLVIDDFIGADSKGILMAWQAQSYNVVTEKGGLASDYKHDAYLVEYTPDMQVVRRWILAGCWISGLSEGEYDKTGEGAKQVTATIEYDYAKLDMSELV